MAPLPAPPARSPVVPILGAVSALAGLLIVLGSFMTWASAVFVSESGTDGGGDGWITVCVGVLMAGVGLALAFRAGEKANGIANAVLGIAAAGLAVFEMVDLTDKSPLISIGGGLYLILAAGLIGAGCAGAAAFQAASGR